MKIREFLKKQRDLRDLTQTQLAQQLRVSPAPFGNGKTASNLTI